MKRRILSLLLACVMVFSVFAFAGCTVDDLEAKVNENAEKADKAASDALAKATDELASAKNELEKAISDGDKSGSDELAKAIEKLNDAIEAVKKAASDADKVNEDALAKAIADLNATIEAAKKATSDGDNANAEALAKAIEDLNSAIEAAKKAASDGNTALKSELEQAIKDANNAMSDAAMKLADWDKATDEIAEKALDELDEEFEKYSSNLYTADGFRSIIDAYQRALIKILRATSVERIQEILDAFKAEADAVASITDEIYSKLCDVKSKFDEINEYVAAEGQTLIDNAAKAMLDEAKTLLDESKALIDNAAEKNLQELNDEIKAYGEAGINLSDLYEEYLEKYESYVEQRDKMIQVSNGEDIKTEMDEALKQLITDTTDLSDIREKYDTWISNPDNRLSDVEGFEATYTAFVEAENRVSKLKEARTEADIINSKVTALDSSIITNGVNKDNYNTLEEIRTEIAEWQSRYFAAPYDAELPAEGREGSVNYNMIDYDNFDKVDIGYQNKIAEYKVAAKNLVDSVKSIGDTVNLLSGDKINAAFEAYNTWIAMTKSLDDDYELEEGMTPADYYGIIAARNAEYVLLRTKALEAYETAFSKVDGITVSIYDGDAVGAMLDWYREYGVWTGDDVIDFGDKGYVLSDTLSVGSADYDTIVKMSADFNTLAEAKKAETATVIDAINAIGTVSTAKKDAIEAAREAYNTWLNGTSVPEGFTAEQYKIKDGDTTYEITNIDTLIEAETTLGELTAAVEAIHAAIEGLDVKTVSTDFTDVEARNAYAEAIDRIRADIAAFKADNNNDLEGNITGDEEAKLAAGELAVIRYDAVAGLVAYADTVKSEAYGISGTYIDSIVESAQTAVDSASAEDEIGSVVALAGAKLDVIRDSNAVCKEYVDAVNALTDTDEETRTLVLIAFEDSLKGNMERTVAAEDNTTVSSILNILSNELNAICEKYNVSIIIE